MTTVRFMVWSQQSTCLLVIASSNTTVIPQQFASRLAYPSAPWRLLQASNWAQLRLLLATFFSPSGRRSLQRWTRPFQASTSSERFSAEATDVYVPIHLHISMCHDDTAVLLLVYIVSWATVVSLVVWARMKGAMGATGVCVCVAAGVRKCVPCLLTLAVWMLA